MAFKSRVRQPTLVFQSVRFAGSFWCRTEIIAEFSPHWLLSRATQPVGCRQYIFNVFSASIVTCLLPLSIQKTPEGCQDSVMLQNGYNYQGRKRQLLTFIFAAAAVFTALTIKPDKSCKQTFKVVSHILNF